MTRSLIPRLAIILMFVLVSASAKATSEEVLWGTYKYEGRKLNISFHWDENGITQMLINGTKYEARCITATSFSTYESWLIRVEDSESRHKLLQLAFLVKNRKVAFVSGYFADIEITDPNSTDFDIKTVQSIEMRYIPLHKK